MWEIWAKSNTLQTQGYKTDENKNRGRVLAECIKKTAAQQWWQNPIHKGKCAPV